MLTSKSSRAEPPYPLPLTLTNRAVYFFLQSSPLQFKVCAIFQLSVDFGEYCVSGFRLLGLLDDDIAAIVAQRIYYGNKLPAILPDIDDIEQALRLADD
jgi:hypothetical protein